MTFDKLVYRKNIIKRKRRIWTDLNYKSGVYFFIYNNKFVYIGRSKDLYTRMLSHHNKIDGMITYGLFDKIGFLYTDNYKEIEKKLIDYFKPIYNGTQNKKYIKTL